MQRRPNILVVHCHDLGDYLHCYGAATVQSPRLDAFAAQGVRFAQSYCTAPQCSPSRASLFTGRYPHANGVMGLCHADFAWDLHPEERHLGQILAGRGYATAAVGIIHETRSGAKRCGYERHSGRPFAAEAVDAAIEELARLGQDPAKPFYLSVGFIEPHRLADGPEADHTFLGAHLEADDALGVAVPPYLADTPGTRTELAELQGAIGHVDAQFGRLMDALAAQGLDDNTLVVFTTDHGYAMPRAKCSLYEPGLRVALMLRLPNRPGWHGGRVTDPMIQNIDVLPSLLDLLGLPKPDNLHGRSFAPLLDSGNYTPRDVVFGEMTYHDYYDPRRSIRTARYKLILNFTAAPFFMDPSQSWRPRSDVVTPPNHARAYHPLVELYDLEQDPWEQRNLAEDEVWAGIRRDLLARLHRHMTQTGDPLLAGTVRSPMDRRAVDALEQAGDGCAQNAPEA